MNKEVLLEKLNKHPFQNSEVTKLANVGNFAEAAEAAAKAGVWGIWGYCREVASLPFDDEARQQWLANYAAQRKARFTK
jgi:hypothetical protein